MSAVPRSAAELSVSCMARLMYPLPRSSRAVATQDMYPSGMAAPWNAVE